MRVALHTKVRKDRIADYEAAHPATSPRNSPRPSAKKAAVFEDTLSRVYGL
ncbi:hypothetical protein ACWD5V_08400 [Streptomyces sp. NPDC002523]